MTEQYTPTTAEVLWAWAEWRRPILERDSWFPTAASLREASNAEFQRWLAKRDAEVAAMAVEGLAESYAYVHAVERTHSYVYKWLRARAAEYRKAVQS